MNASFTRQGTVPQPGLACIGPPTLPTTSWRATTSLQALSVSSTTARSASTADVSSAKLRWNFSGDCRATSRGRIIWSREDPTA